MAKRSGAETAAILDVAKRLDIILEKAVKVYCAGLLHWNLRFFWQFLSSPYGWVRFHLKTARKTLNFGTLDQLATASTAFSRIIHEDNYQKGREYYDADQIGSKIRLTEFGRARARSRCSYYIAVCPNATRGKNDRKCVCKSYFEYEENKVHWFRYGPYPDSVQY